MRKAQIKVPMIGGEIRCRGRFIIKWLKKECRRVINVGFVMCKTFSGSLDCLSTFTKKEKEKNALVMEKYRDLVM